METTPTPDQARSKDLFDNNSLPAPVSEANKFESGQFDDASEATGSFPVRSVYCSTVRSSGGLHTASEGSAPMDQTGMRSWTDEQVNDILMTRLVDDVPQNVLDYRRRWPQPPMPDTRQVNRVLYKLHGNGEIQECPPNGANQKPCWIRRTDL